MERKLSEEVTAKEAGKNVLLKGWVYEVRDFGKLKFLILRDKSGFIQITAHKEKTSSAIFDELSNLSKESAVEVKGKVQQSNQAPGGREVLPESIAVLAKAEQPLPIDITERSKTELPKRLDWRPLDLRQPKHLAIFKIRSAFLQSAVNWFSEKGFIQINSPKIMAAGAEGGATLFSLMYFNKPAFLAQSPQIYKQEVQCAFEKVFEIGNFFRAEPFHTPRHICEFTGLDYEISFIESEEDVMKVCEEMLRDVMKELKEKCKKEFELLNIQLKVPKIPFPRVSFKDALKITKKKELDPETERKIAEYAEKKFGSEFIWIKNFPWKEKPFYAMQNKNGTAKDFDLIFKGLELVSGNQREHRPDMLIKQIKAKGLNPDAFKSYVDSFKYGMPAHGGLGLGIDRFIKQLLNLSNIREAVLFPRDPERLTP